MTSFWCLLGWHKKINDSLPHDYLYGIIGYKCKVCGTKWIEQKGKVYKYKWGHELSPKERIEALKRLSPDDMLEG